MTMPYPPAVPPAPRTSGLAIAGFVCSFFCGLIGLILSIMGRNECKRSGGTVGGGGLALAGIIISSISLAFGVLGVLAAVAIPSFMDYQKKSKKTEAALELNKVSRNAKRVYIETSSFPPGSAPLTPPEPCCGQPNNHCGAVPALYAADPVWKSLDFQIDEDTLFQYSYSASSDGQSFIATAVGDLDCDGTLITYELRGAVTNGNPSTTLIEPPLNAD
jgi:type II secretory pathway pseudopilin PulG